MDLDKVAALEPVVDEAAVMDELDGFVRGWKPAEEASPRWHITSLGAAEWALRKLAEVEARAHEYDEEVSRWSAARDRIRKAGEFFEGHLKQWAISQRTPAVKSFPLASGTVATRESPPRVEVVDEDRAIAWAGLYVPLAVKTVRSFLLKESGVKVVKVIVGFDVTDKTTGESDHVKVDPPIVAGPGVDLAAVAAPLNVPMGDKQFGVDVCYDLRAMWDGKEVPGLTVRAAKVTATVSPLHP